MLLIYRLVMGFVGSLVLGTLAYLGQTLTFSGLTAILFIGTISFLWAPPICWLLLLLFFGSSWLISTIKRLTSIGPTPETTGKSSHRDACQLLANSLPYLLAVAGWQLTGEHNWWIVAAAAIAGATSDTWASEIGVLSKRPPRNILLWQTETIGSSGAVSRLGLAASLGGSLLISGVFYTLTWLFDPDQVNLTWFLIPLAAGFFNSMIDSFLGATLQGKFLTKDGHLVETAQWQQQETTLLRGLPWLNNDGVNLLSGLLTILLAWLLLQI